MSDPISIRDIVPADLAGKWIAWDEEAIHIVASGTTADEAVKNAREAGVAEPYLDKAPPPGFIGSL